MRRLKPRLEAVEREHPSTNGDKAITSNPRPKSSYGQTDSPKLM